MRTKALETEVLDYHLSDGITFGEAISFYDSFGHPDLDGLYGSALNQKEATLLIHREGWLRSCIKDYNNPNVPSSAKNKTAEEVGRYFLNSALNYIHRINADDEWLNDDS